MEGKGTGDALTKSDSKVELKALVTAPGGHGFRNSSLEGVTCCLH